MNEYVLKLWLDLFWVLWVEVVSFISACQMRLFFLPWSSNNQRAPSTPVPVGGCTAGMLRNSARDRTSELFGVGGLSTALTICSLGAGGLATASKTFGDGGLANALTSFGAGGSAIASTTFLFFFSLFFLLVMEARLFFFFLFLFFCW